MHKAKTSKTRQLIGLSTLLLAATPAHALTWRNPVESLNKLPSGRLPLELTPFTADNPLTPRGFSLFERGEIGFQEAVASAVRDRLATPIVEVRGSDISGAFGLVGGTRTHEFRFYVGGVPLCGFQIRAHEFADRSSLVLGSIPDIDAYLATPVSDWPDRARSGEKAAESLFELSGSRSSVALKHAERCLHVANGGLLPVWNLTLVQDDLPYTAFADAYETVALERAYFDVTGSAKVYPSNSVEGKPLTDFELPDLTGNGTLTSEYLKIYVPTGYTLANEANHVFNYPETDERFTQASAYTHAQMHFDYFKSLGFAWYGPKPIEIQLHVKPAGRINNALFIPGSDASGALPTIQIHDGDGIDLQALCLDGDVVSHEFGHHVIYKTLRSTEGQSLVLHEGLADFFAFMRTGDACLGESICPKGSGACIIESKCLRTADNPLVYKDEYWNAWAGSRNRLGHLHGQLISGLLWDLRKSGAVPASDLSKLVFSAIGMFQSNSGFRDFAITLFMSDRQFFGSKYMKAIRAAIEARGLTEFLEGIPEDTTSDLPSLTGGSAAEPDSALPGGNTDAPEKQSSKGKSAKNPLHCGTVFAAGSTGGNLLVILILLAPFFPVLKPALVPAKKPRKGKAHVRDK